jgi:predicted Rossmann-fold nucleotide-binding protein
LTSFVLINSSHGSHITTIALGKALAVAQRPLVYGGGVRGIMGIVSRAALKAGGEVVGVIPQAILAIGEGEQTSLDGSTHPVDSREDTREKVETHFFS